MGFNHPFPFCDDVNMVGTQPQFPMKCEVTGHGDPVVLVPGALTGWISWKPHAKQLSANHRVLRVQLISVNLGLRSQPLPPNYSIESEMDALRSTLDLLKISRADFVGWSYGAEISLGFALKNPQRVNSLTLIEPPALWALKSRGLLPEDLVEHLKQVRLLGPDDVNESQLAWYTHFAGLVPAEVNPWTVPSWELWCKYRQSLRIGNLAFRHDVAIQEIRNYRGRVLLVKGESSSDFFKRIIDILGEEFPDARVESLPGDHASHMASMDKFLKTLQSFLAGAHKNK